MSKISNKERKRLKVWLADVFCDQIKDLPAEFRLILLDDMVTAFENRISVLEHAGQAEENTVCVSTAEWAQVLKHQG